MEERFNLDNDRAERLHSLYQKLDQFDCGEIELSDTEYERIQKEKKELEDVETKRYVSDNEASSRIEAAEIEAKSRKEPWYKPVLAFVAPTLLGAAIKGIFDVIIARERMDRFETQHRLDQEYDMTGTLSRLSESTEKHYDPYKQR